LVTRQTDGYRVNRKANAAHPIFAKLQSVIRKTCGLPSQLKSSLTPLADRLSFATVYGSMAKLSAPFFALVSCYDMPM
jgi:hypothetical protein